jgi:hypothetical protein
MLRSDDAPRRYMTTAQVIMTMIGARRSRSHQTMYRRGSVSTILLVNALLLLPMTTLVDRCKGDQIEDNADYKACVLDPAGCTSLSVADVTYTPIYTGTLPTQLGTLTALTSLILNSGFMRVVFVNLNGTLPSELGALTSLEGLELGMNSLTGSIPSEWAGMTSLRHM